MEEKKTSGSPGFLLKSLAVMQNQHQVKSVDEYIGDSGKELEGAAEQIVESYMGEYMQVENFDSFAF